MSQPNTKTPAMVLQEFTVRHSFSPPEYTLVRSKTGTHENEFHYKVNVANIVAFGFGHSKQVAKQNTASKALEMLAEKGLYDPKNNPAQEFNPQSHRNESDSPLLPPVNFIGTLKDTCYENKLPYPIFTEISDVGPPHCREFTYECKVDSIKTQATANTKKQAKQLSAREMLEKIRDICPQLAEIHLAESNALTDKDQEAINKYHELSSGIFKVIPNRAVKVADFPLTIKKIMVEKDVKIEDFDEPLKKRDADSLNYIMNTLDIKYEVRMMQLSPPIAVAVFGIDTPFTLLSLGSNEDNAKRNVIGEVFKVLDVYMNVSLESDNRF